MEFKKLSFTKDWNSKTDFPTYEPDEAQVRRDLQCLHDETREFINETLIPEVEEALSGIETGGGSGADIELDTTLSREGMAADAKAVGDAIAGLDVGVKTVNGVEPDEHGDVALTGPEIVSGSYVGTGTHGADNPNSLTFDFEPEVVILENKIKYTNGTGFGTTTLLRGVTRVVVCHRGSDSGEIDTYELDVVWDGNTVSWSCYYGAAWQLNDEGTEYHYTAIGAGAGGSGGTITEEDRAEIKDAVLAELDPTVTAISTVLSGTTMTFMETLEDGSTDNIIVTLDDNGVPTGMTVNGTAVGVTMEGF